MSLGGERRAGVQRGARRAAQTARLGGRGRPGWGKRTSMLCAHGPRGRAPCVALCPPPPALSRSWVRPQGRKRQSRSLSKMLRSSVAEDACILGSGSWCPQRQARWLPWHRGWQQGGVASRAGQAGSSFWGSAAPTDLARKGVCVKGEAGVVRARGWARRAPRVGMRAGHGLGVRGRIRPALLRLAPGHGDAVVGGALQAPRQAAAPSRAAEGRLLCRRPSPGLR